MSERSTSGKLSFDREGHRLVIAFERSSALNALSRDMQAELREVLDRSASEGDRAIILTGSGRAFSSGQDLKEMASRSAEVTPEAIDAARSELEAMQGLTRALLNHPGVTIAAVNGLAVGLGSELALACDLRVMSTGATIAFPEARRGLFQTNGVMFLLPRIVGHTRALDLMLTGRTMKAEEAERIGFAQLADGDVLAAAKAKADAILANAPTAVRAIKRGALAALQSDLDTAMEMEVEGMLAALRTEDLWEGVTAFAEGREPEWPGR